MVFRAFSKTEIFEKHLIARVWRRRRHLANPRSKRASNAANRNTNGPDDAATLTATPQRRPTQQPAYGPRLAPDRLRRQAPAVAPARGFAHGQSLLPGR